MRNTAILASARAHIPKNHEGGRSRLPTLPNIRTTSLFAYGMEALCPHFLLQAQIIGTSGRAHLKPRWLPRPDVYGLQAFVGPDSRGTLGLYDTGVFAGWRVSLWRVGICCHVLLCSRNVRLQPSHEKKQL